MEYIENFIEIKRGSIPIILTVPHGGTLEPRGIPKRTTGILGVDKGTIELARELGISRVRVTQYLNLLKQPKTQLDYIMKNGEKEKITERSLRGGFEKQITEKNLRHYIL